MSFAELRRDLGFLASVVKGRPFQCLVQVTNRCNMKCPFCDFWPNGAPPQKELTLAELTRLADELSEIGRFLVSIEGGEPFVRPDLVPIVAAFARRHVAVLYTNGWYVTDEAARSLFGAGLAQVGVSIDFPDAARHDAKRRLPGAFDRAWRAVEAFRRAAPHGGRQVHVMTVLMEENRTDVPALLARCDDAGVGHSLTLLSTHGFRRAEGGALPAAGVSRELLALRRAHPQFRVFRDYLEGIDDFLTDRSRLPACRAGSTGFNVDHLGAVAPCIEKIDRPVGSLRNEPLAKLLPRLAAARDVAGCQECFTACRGFGQALGDVSPRALFDLASRMRST
jgi:MoaA/NifB/PqqE/SkfB family radical SAM enzyme